MVSWRALLVAGLVLGAATPVAARSAGAPQDAGQEAPPARDEPAMDGAGNEIIVTATKREQTLQDIPVAVTVTTAETIERAKIRDIQDLATVVPSLRVVEHQSSAQTDFNIRGFGNGANNAGIEPSVGVFIDGVYRSRSAAQIADFPDVKRVEVLRGPQSTLFGKNASAGVISIVTAAPQFKLGGNGEVSYGNYNAVVAKGAITGPLSETVAVSLAGGYNRRDGYVHDAGTGNDTNNRNRWFVRGQVLYEPNTQLKVRLIGDYGKIDEVCCAVYNVKASDPQSTATAVIRSLGGQVNAPGAVFGDVYNNADSTNRIENYGVSGQVDYAIGPLTLTSITAWRKNANRTSQDSDFTSLRILGTNVADVRIRTFTQEFRASTNMEGPINFVAGAYYFNEKIGQTGELLYGKDARNYATGLATAGGGFPPGTSIGTLEGQFGALQGQPTLYLGKFFAEGTGFHEQYSLKNEAISGFGQVDFKVAPRLTLTGGVNYTHDKKTFATTGTYSDDAFSAVPLLALANPANNFDPVRGALIAQTVGGVLGLAQIQGFALAQPALFQQIGAGALASAQTIAGLHRYQFLPPFVNVPGVGEPGKTSDGNVSFTARAAYDVNRHLNAYLSVATGFKASSVNLSRDSRPNQRFAGPEKSTVYEAGIKGNWDVATLNFAVFEENIKGFQSNIFTGTGFVLSNAGKESVFGFEFEGSAKPTAELTLSQSLTYLKPKYDSYPGSPFGDISNRAAASIPPISLTSTITWDHRLGNADRVVLRGDWHYESATQIEDGLPGFIDRNPITLAVNNPPAGYQPGIDEGRNYVRTVSEFDASLTWVSHTGFEVSLWGRNLTDNRYLSVVFDSPLQPGSVSAYANQPRTFGGSVSYKF
jgi:outer membrane receptor protein involved in Fe transport